MDFDFSDEQKELRSSVRTVLEQECPLSLVREVVDGAAAVEQPWKSAAELGWTAVAIPEAWGGLGLGFEELGLVLEEHGRALAPGPYLPTTTQFAAILREAGSDEQRARFLAGVAEGELTGSLAFAGASGIGLLPDASLEARREGQQYRLQGDRYSVLCGDLVDEIVAVARIDEGDGAEGVGLFVVPRGAVKVQPVVSLDASRPLAHLHFDGVEVGPERILGSPGEGLEPLQRALDEANVGLALETVGVCQSLLDITVAYAKQRIQFDVPIGSFQAIQHKCADMLVALEKARSTAYFAMMTVAEDDPRRRLAASMARAAAGECQQLICKEAIQIHGGTGFTWECDVHLYVKRAKTNAALFGTTREHRARVADLLLAD